jgi:hypothetical protein
MAATISLITRKYVTRIIIVVFALMTLLSYLFVAPQITSNYNSSLVFNTNMGYFYLFSGLLVISIRFIRRIIVRAEEWYFGAFALVIIAAWVVYGTIVGYSSSEYIKAYYSTKVALHASAIGLLLFFNLSAVYRVFRMQNFRSVLFLVCASILVAANSPWGQSLFPGINVLGAWIMDNLQMPGARTITMIEAVGAIAISVRILLGMERGALRAVTTTETGGGD